jgi:predicted  nucleic acid-binding Zn-ribbon protein
MYSAEVLSQLRSLNWLALEVRRLPAGSREGALLLNQINSLRDRLPDAILEHHDRLAREGKITAAEVSADACSSCRTKLPPPLLKELSQPGHFNVCPNCGVFLWAVPDAQNPPEKPEAKRVKNESHPHPHR